MIKINYLKYFWIYFALLLQFQGRAAHIVGGDIYYDYLGNNNYKFYVSVYRDCNTITGAAYDNPLHLGIFNHNNIRIQNVEIIFPGSEQLPIIFSNPCVVTPTGICTERAIYVSQTINLPPIFGGYTIAYQRCCRQPAIINIIDAANTGLTIVAHIPGSETNMWANSSPRFTNYPPLVICNNDDLIFNHSATDPNGDQLVYSLVTPFAGATSGNPAPNPIPAPNYPSVFWEAGHSVAQPLGPGSNLQIDPTTGILTASPNLIGLYVVGIRVSEYRNGVYLGGNTRDFLFQVINCNISLQAILPLQTDLPDFAGYCNGLNVNFVNNSYGATNYAWDFGVPNTNTDISTQATPSFTYPQPGTYMVRLIANPGWPCRDTAFMNISVDVPFTVDFTSNDSVCFIDHSIDFQGSIANNPFPNPITLNWSFGPDASITQASTLNVNNVVYNQSGSFPVLLTADRNLCHHEVAKDVYIFPTPTTDFSMPEDYECDGQTIHFQDLSQNAFVYHWNFGDLTTALDTSGLENPTYTYPSPGIYTIQLISGSSGICFDTAVYTYEIYQDMDLSFTHEDSLCITGNSFDFIGTVSGPDFATYSWNFGNSASPSVYFDTSVYNVVYSTFGNHTVTFTGSYLQCNQSVTSNVFIYREPSINFGIQPGSQCAPFLAHFLDSSISDTPLDYLWDFGDGSPSSTLQNPTHLFESPGNYPITLNIKTDEGCPADLTLTKGNLVNVRPVPVASFTTSTDRTDICNSMVIFYDHSTGASKISYYVDDNEYFASDVPVVFPYSYQSSGNHHILQIVENEYACSDSSKYQVYIDPFTIFVPNAFTPDGDQYNNEWKPEVALPANEWHLEVFDRWGEKIWESFDQKVGWDGFYGNHKSPQGIYSYKIEVESCSKEDKYQLITGHFSLLR